MKQLSTLIAALLLIGSFTSCESSYSPIDEYTKAVAQRTYDSLKYEREVKAFQDSMTKKYQSIK